MFLFPGLGRPDLRRMTDPILDAQLVQQLQKPLHRPGGFQAHHHRTF
jgi:hypothetical protein